MFNGVVIPSVDGGQGAVFDQVPQGPPCTMPARCRRGNFEFMNQRPTIVYQDNIRATHWAQDHSASEFSKRKQVYVRYHYVREQMLNGEIKLKQVVTNKMEVDFLTKAMTLVSLERSPRSYKIVSEKEDPKDIDTYSQGTVKNKLIGNLLTFSNSLSLCGSPGRFVRL